jgi:hypothetical protein
VVARRVAGPAKTARLRAGEVFGFCSVLLFMQLPRPEAFVFMDDGQWMIADG